MLSGITSFLNSLIGSILSFLPNSPFTEFISSISNTPWLGYLNWFVPVGTFLSIGAAWLGAIIVFYTYQMILRWAKAVAD